MISPVRKNVYRSTIGLCSPRPLLRFEHEILRLLQENKAACRSVQLKVVDQELKERPFLIKSIAPEPSMAVTASQEPIKTMVSCYATRVLQKRHRIVALRGRKCEARIMLTLLGFEVKAGRKRISCPDMTTARYLSLFAEIGMRQLRIPYDPPLTARAIPKIEAALKGIHEPVGEQA